MAINVSVLSGFLILVCLVCNISTINHREIRECFNNAECHNKLRHLVESLNTVESTDSLSYDSLPPHLRNILREVFVR